MAVDVGLGVIQLFLHPPVGLLRLEPISGGPFFGRHEHQRTRLNTFTDAYGVHYSVADIPPGYGSVPGAGADLYDRVVFRASVTHILLSGQHVVTQDVAVANATGFFLFTESFPFNVIFENAPGVSLNLNWMVRLLP